MNWYKKIKKASFWDRGEKQEAHSSNGIKVSFDKDFLESTKDLGIAYKDLLRAINKTRLDKGGGIASMNIISGSWGGERRKVRFIPQQDGSVMLTNFVSVGTPSTI